MFNLPKEKGQSLIEVLIVLTVSIMVLVALVALVVVGLKNAQFAQSQAKATKYAQQTLDNIKSIKDRDLNVNLLIVGSGTDTLTFSDFLADNNKCPNTAPCLFARVSDTELNESTSSHEISGESLSEEIKIWSSGTNEKTVSVKVSWVDSAGEHSSNLQTILTNR